MRKTMKLLVMAVAAMMCVPVMGQVTIKGVVNNNRYDDGDQLENKSNYVGYTTKIEPVQYPNIPVSEYYSGGTFTDPEKALLVTGFNKMIGNSGAVYANGELWTVFCRDYQSSEPEDMFVVRHWDATTGQMLKEFPHYSEDKVLESAGMAFNPIDNHIYGLFCGLRHRKAEHRDNGGDAHNKGALLL